MANDIDQVRLSELKNEVQQHWSKLTAEDISRLTGNTDDLIAVLRRRYGYGKAQAEIEIHQWLDNLQPHSKKIK